MTRVPFLDATCGIHRANRGAVDRAASASSLQDAHIPTSAYGKRGRPRGAGSGAAHAVAGSNDGDVATTAAQCRDAHGGNPSTRFQWRRGWFTGVSGQRSKIIARFRWWSTARLACPSPYVVSTTLYQSHSPDNARGCAPCTCPSAPAGGSCAGGSVTLYGASGCPPTGGAVTPVTVGAGTTCATSGLRDVASAGNASPPTLTDAGACAAEGGGPVGSTIPTGPITVCCTP
jgi:hypothetical protein